MYIIILHVDKPQSLRFKQEAKDTQGFRAANSLRG